MVVGLGPRYDVCRTTRSLGGGIKEIVAARSWNHHTLPEGLALCPAILCALTYIYPSHPGVRYSRYVASCCHVRGQDSYLPPPRQGPLPDRVPAIRQERLGGSSAREGVGVCSRSNAI